MNESRNVKTENKLVCPICEETHYAEMAKQNEALHKAHRIDIEAIQKDMAKMSDLRKELITAYDNYIKLLGDELGELVPAASLHGWKSHRYDEGVELRARIEKIKSVYFANSFLSK